MAPVKTHSYEDADLTTALHPNSSVVKPKLLISSHSILSGYEC
jgi:hypothetical protein